MLKKLVEPYAEYDLHSSLPKDELTAWLRHECSITKTVFSWHALKAQ